MACTRFAPRALLCMIVLLATPSLQQQCYYPNGQIVKSGSLGSAVPCPDTDSCCIEGDACFTGGMCFSTANGAVYRGFWTESSWSSSSSCPRACTTGGTDFMWVNSCGGAESCCAGTDNTVNCCGAKNFGWGFTPLGVAGSSDSSSDAGNDDDGSDTSSSVSALDNVVSGTTTIVATVTSTNTLVSFETAGAGDAGAAISSAAAPPLTFSITTVTAGSGAAPMRCDGLCGLFVAAGTLALRWL